MRAIPHRALVALLLAGMLARASAGIDAWRTASVDTLVAYLDPPSPPRSVGEPGGVEATRHRVDETIARMGVPLSTEDRATIDRFHRRFIADGLSLRFQSTGRP